MAHPLLHFAAGLAAGTVLCAPAVMARIRAGGKASRAAAAMLLTAYGLAMLAVVPNLLHRMGAPPAAVSGWWMNLFLLHPLIDSIENGGMLIGELGLAACFLVQYILLLAAIRARGRARR